MTRPTHHAAPVPFRKRSLRRRKMANRGIQPNGDLKFKMQPAKRRRLSRAIGIARMVQPSCLCASGTMRGILQGSGQTHIPELWSIA
jgi:hypothetical protein